MPSAAAWVNSASYPGCDVGVDPSQLLQQLPRMAVSTTNDRKNALSIRKERMASFAKVILHDTEESGTSYFAR